MAFVQDPPKLGNQFDDDPLLPSWVARFILHAADELRALASQLCAVAAPSAGYWGLTTVRRCQR